MCQVPPCSLLNQAKARKVSKNTFSEKKHTENSRSYMPRLLSNKLVQVILVLDIWQVSPLLSLTLEIHIRLKYPLMHLEHCQ